MKEDVVIESVIEGGVRGTQWREKLPRLEDFEENTLESC